MPDPPYEVLLANRGNPDFGQDERKHLPGWPADRWVEVKSFAEASRVCRVYIEAHSLGGGHWAGGKIRIPGTTKQVGYVSYNGRVWPGKPKDWTPETQPLYDDWPRDPK